MSAVQCALPLLPVAPSHDGIVVAIEPVGRIALELAKTRAAQQHGIDPLDARVDVVCLREVSAPDGDLFSRGLLPEIAQGVVLSGSMASQKAQRNQFQKFQSIHASHVSGVGGFVQNTGGIPRGAR